MLPRDDTPPVPANLLAALLAALTQRGLTPTQGGPAPGPAATPMPAQGAALGGEGEYGGDEYAHAGWGTAQPYDYGPPVPHAPTGGIAFPPTPRHVNPHPMPHPARRGMGDFPRHQAAPQRRVLLPDLYPGQGAHDVGRAHWGPNPPPGLAAFIARFRRNYHPTFRPL